MEKLLMIRTAMISGVVLLAVSATNAAQVGEEDFCATVVKVPKEGYVLMYNGPGNTYGIQTRLVKDDFLYADTSRCSIWNENACTDAYTHIYSVHRIDGAPRDNLHGFTIGWVYTSYIKSVSCDLDWGYVDPDPPNIDPP
jgi:hypothetical protein